MAVYFDYKIPAGGAEVRNPRWSQDLSSEPCLAVGIDNTLQVFTQEGEPLIEGDEGKISVPKKGGTPKASKATVESIDWHPTQKLLCAGWNDGTVTFMRTGGNISSSSTSVAHMGQEAHQNASILAVKFSPTGHLCVAADSEVSFRRPVIYALRRTQRSD